MGIYGVDVFQCGGAMNKISACGVAVIWNSSVCDVFVFQATVFGEMKLFAVLWFLVWSFSDLNLASKLRLSVITYDKHVPLCLICNKLQTNIVQLIFIT